MRRALWMLALVAACDDGGSSDSKSEPDSYQCDYSFELSVRSGPSAGLSVSGPFSLQQQADGTYVGGLLDKATGHYFPVTGKASGELRFTTPEGATIVGQGPALGDFAQRCPEDLQGDLTGPQAGDTGDWQSRCCIEIANDTAVAVCNACLQNSGARPGTCGNCAVCAFQGCGGGAELQQRYGVEVQ
jgi:hypothetical protein